MRGKAFDGLAVAGSEIGRLGLTYGGVNELLWASDAPATRDADLPVSQRGFGADYADVTRYSAGMSGLGPYYDKPSCCDDCASAPEQPCSGGHADDNLDRFGSDGLPLMNALGQIGLSDASQGAAQTIPLKSTG